GFRGDTVRNDYREGGVRGSSGLSPRRGVRTTTSGVRRAAQGFFGTDSAVRTCALRAEVSDRIWKSRRQRVRLSSLLARRSLRPLEKGARKRAKAPDSGFFPSPFSRLPSPAVQKA